MQHAQGVDERLTPLLEVVADADEVGEEGDDGDVDQDVQRCKGKEEDFPLQRETGTGTRTGTLQFVPYKHLFTTFLDQTNVITDFACTTPSISEV